MRRRRNPLQPDRASNPDRPGRSHIKIHCPLLDWRTGQFIEQLVGHTVALETARMNLVTQHPPNLKCRQLAWSKISATIHGQR